MIETNKPTFTTKHYKKMAYLINTTYAMFSEKEYQINISKVVEEFRKDNPKFNETKFRKLLEK